MATAKVYSQHGVPQFSGNASDCVDMAMTIAERFGRTLFVRFNDGSQLRVSEDGVTGMPIISRYRAEKEDNHV